MTEDTYGDNLLIYRFWPHGAKKLQDLLPLNPLPENFFLLPKIFCNDQEPLFYDFYEAQLEHIPPSEFVRLKKELFGSNITMHSNFRWVFDVNDFAFLLHSEKRSENLTRYQEKNFVSIYYWNHALLARDWFRYAQHAKFNRQSDKLFLIYNRAWAGTREYRLKFADLLIENNLTTSCLTSLNAIEPQLNMHYNAYTFQNSIWKPTHVLENYFEPNQSASQYSADFEISDYNRTDIEVVLETLFDDGRLHLTEKSLRPIACGQPFILAATHGSLKYLHEYGFKTFETVWNEDYDDIKDPGQRMHRIMEVMTSINCWDPHTKKQKLSQAREIAEYNRRYFFSDKFFELIIQELKTNFETAIQLYKQKNSNQIWNAHWKNWLQHEKILKWVNETSEISNELKTTILSNCNVVTK